jgi:hypothetical protein
LEKYRANIKVSTIDIINIIAGIIKPRAGWPIRDTATTALSILITFSQSFIFLIVDISEDHADD